MAVSRGFGLLTVAAISIAVTVGCGSSSQPTAQSSQPAGAVNEDSGQQKKIGKLQSGAPLTGAERGAIMSTKGHGEP